MCRERHSSALVSLHLCSSTKRPDMGDGWGITGKISKLKMAYHLLVSHALEITMIPVAIIAAVGSFNFRSCLLCVVKSAIIVCCSMR